MRVSRACPCVFVRVRAVRRGGGGGEILLDSPSFPRKEGRGSSDDHHLLSPSITTIATTTTAHCVPPVLPRTPNVTFFFFYIFCSWEAAVWFCILGCADFRFSRNAKRNRTNIGRRLAWLFVFAPLSAGIQRTLNEKRHFVELFFFIPRSRFEVPPFRLLHISLSLGKANAHLRLLLSFPFHASCVT
ncbi:unnamed protein product [Ixodes persulcatus]